MAKRRDDSDFRAFYAAAAKRAGLSADPDDREHFYDYRAAFKAGAGPDSTGHFPSRFKRLGHPNLVVEGRDTRSGKKAGRLLKIRNTLERRHVMGSRKRIGG